METSPPTAAVDAGDTARLCAMPPPPEPADIEPEPLRAAFEEQATPALMRAALRYARQRAVLVRRAGRRIDDLYCRELVQDALTDTWMGTVAWNPARTSLLDHIRGVIRSRTWKDANGVRRRPHVAIESERTEAEADAAWRHATTGSVSPILLASLGARVIRDLRRLAQDDPAATAILDAWSVDLVERTEVLQHTGLTERAYKAARGRLAYLVLSLPRSLHETALAHLRSAS